MGRNVNRRTRRNGHSEVPRGRFERLETRCFLAADPVISEFLASNQSILQDGPDKTPDWIEIHNAGDETVDLAGWHLTDDPLQPTQWVFPDVDEASLEPGDYLLIRASGEDTVDDAGRIHTNFKLSAGGEYVALLTPARSIVSEFGSGGADYPEQFEDVSYGTAADGSVGYFLEPTPGAPNSATVAGFVADTRFSVDRGFFETPFTVEITSATPGATIVYTTDGSEPTLTHGTTVTAERGNTPLAAVPIATTTTLRAAAFKTGFEPTNVDTQTYLFLADVIHQSDRPAGFPAAWNDAPAADYEMDPQIVEAPAYQQDLLRGLRELPTVSLVSSVDNIFGSGGIYANPTNDALEVPTSIEWIQPDGQTEFQMDAGLRISGGASRSPNNSPKHSMSVRFRSQYGAGRLTHPLFPDSPVDVFNSLQLRAMYNNSWIHWSSEQQHRGALIRDQFIRDSLIAMGQIDAGRGTYAHVYINGLYWGVYNVHERADAAHYAEYWGGDAEDYDARNGNSVTDGTSTSFNRMRSIVANTDDWSEVEAVLDVDNFIDWTLVQAYGGNEDIKLDGNWRAVGSGSEIGKWRIYAWDSERVLESVQARPPAQIVDAMQIRDNLLRFPEFVLRMGDRVEKHFQHHGALTPEAVAERWNARVAELANAIVAESARWGDYRRDVHRRGNNIQLYERDQHWLAEMERLRTNYFPQRSDFVYRQLQTTGWVPDLDAPQLEVNGAAQHGGVVGRQDRIGFTLGSQQQTVTKSQPLLGPESPVVAFVPQDDTFETGARPLWYDEAFDAGGWQAGVNGVGYENSANGAYRNLLGTDIGTAWNANRTSVYTRFEFTVPDDFSTFDQLLLKMTFDDGFVAYLNGMFLDVDPGTNRNLAPAIVRWNSLTSADDRPDSVVLSGPVAFDLTPYRHLLRSGTNLLAIHGLSHSTTSSDMLIAPELLLQKTELASPDIYFTLDGSDPRDALGNAAGTLYTEPVTVERATQIQARRLVEGRWSALVQADFLVEPLPGDINGDGGVDFADFLILSANYGQQQDQEPLPGDLDGDQIVGFSDFLILAANFGQP